MSGNSYCIRKCGHYDLEVLTVMRLEFLKEAGHIKDGDDISSLYNELLEFMKVHLDKDLHIWVAESDGKAVATGAVSIWDKLPTGQGKDNRSKIGYVSNMYTRPEYRKKGIAGSIVQHILQFMKDEGISKTMLHALEDGKGIYRKSGFATNENFMEMKI
jgi:GNAT superfamily N-acetyltransferase